MIYVFFFVVVGPKLVFYVGLLLLAGCFLDFYDSFCSPIFKMHEFFHIFCCYANGAWLDWVWGLPENVVRCAFFFRPARGFSRQVLVLLEFLAVVARFC